MPYAIRSIVSRFSKYVSNKALWVVAVLAFSLFGPVIWAQNNPTFIGGGKLSNTTDGSPAMATANGITCMVYQNAGTGNLAAVQSTDGVHWGSSVDTGFAMANSVVAATNYGPGFYILFATSTGFQETTSTNCTTFNTPAIASILAPNGYSFGYQPGLAVWNGRLYLSVNVPIPNGYAAGLLYSTDGGVTFSNYQIPAYTNINAGSSLITYTPSGSSTPYLYQAFTEGLNNNPEIAQTSDGTDWTAAADTSMEIGGDPNLAVFTASGSDPAIYVFGRSNYSENNLWVTGTYDGVNFTPEYEYGMSLHDSPSDVIAPTGYLVSSFHSNFSSNNLWSYYAEY